MSEAEVPRHLFFAPHVDDAFIGCWSVLYYVEIPARKIIYTEKVDEVRGREASEMRDAWGVDIAFVDGVRGAIEELQKNIRENKRLGWPSLKVYAPDFYFETHPAHRALGCALWNEVGPIVDKRFFVYSTNMNVPYLRELDEKDARIKRAALDKYFPSQSSLWDHDHRYFLFEGIAQWDPWTAITD